MNIVIYARYSSHSQTEQSIEGQLHTCYEYARNNGHITLTVPRVERLTAVSNFSV